MERRQVKFEDSDAYLFKWAMSMGLGGADTARHFDKSMQLWDKQLLAEASNNKGNERE